MKPFNELQGDEMSPRKMDFTYIQVGFPDEDVKFLNAERRRRHVPRVQVVRDAVTHYRIFLRNGSTGEQGQPIDKEPTP